MIFRLTAAFIAVVFILWFLVEDLPHVVEPERKTEERLGRFVIAIILAGLTYLFSNDFPGLFGFSVLGWSLAAYFISTAAYFPSDRLRDPRAHLPWQLP